MALYLQSLLNNTFSGDIVALAGYDAADKLQKLGLTEEDAKTSVLKLLKTMRRQKSPIDSMFEEMPDLG